MDSERSGTDLSGYVFPGVMLVLGVVVAALVASMPQASLDVLMWRLWLPHIIQAATPPIGATGRTLLALVALAPFVAAAAIAWQRGGRVLPIVRKRGVLIDRAPSVRRADAHPDCPPRRPIRAEEDLGPPLPMVTVAPGRGVPGPEQPLPIDFDQPLAAFDPISIPDVPREPIRAVPPLATVVVPARDEDEDAPVETAEFVAAADVPDGAQTGEPSAMQPIVSESPAMLGTEPVEAGADEGASLSSLLDRLERGAERRKTPEPVPPSAPTGSLNDTLVMLRRMARH